MTSDLCNLEKSIESFDAYSRPVPSQIYIAYLVLSIQHEMYMQCNLAENNLKLE